MSSRPQSNPQPPSTNPPPLSSGLPARPGFPAAAQQHAFRETFIQRFPKPGIADACRVVGDALVDALNEAGAWGPKSSLPLTYGELRAACQDLDHLVGYLEEVAGERVGSDLEPLAEALSARAGGWSDRLAGLVLDMRRTLDEAEQAGTLDVDPGTTPGGPN